eukprot:gnl/TRDRNA2_/TRDRNA2_65203_c0_seq1.p2 gnl/TRDRNA2_/TRDRNA2_65203_c0~~gnl/TRDRNA2_/TRDRNA2_65203_c0_seq1.p2  ORF type:complete len:127 (-),score=10.92 gnl/TRDRNA2_/TRDRNA2_65203_c0_seq1:283-663(-)
MLLQRLVPPRLCHEECLRKLHQRQLHEVVLVLRVRSCVHSVVPRRRICSFNIFGINAINVDAVLLGGISGPARNALVSSLMIISCAADPQYTILHKQSIQQFECSVVLWLLVSELNHHMQALSKVS